MQILITPVIIRRSSHNISRTNISPNALRIMYRLRDNGFKAFLVGGSVRDLLLERTPKDFDLATDATPSEIKRLFRNCRLVGRRFRLAHLHFKDEVIEVATFRKGADEAESEEFDEESEEVTNDNSHLQKSEEGMLLRDNLFGTPEEDAWRRDFTVNALAYRIDDFSIIDYVGGIEDLQKEIIRSIGDPHTRFAEDPVRMIRGVRLSAQLDFAIEHHSWEAILENSRRITLASPARLFDELVKTLVTGYGFAAWEMFSRSGLAMAMLPDFHDWTLQTAENSPSRGLQWVDRAVREGRAVSTPLLLAVVFGAYIRSLANQLFPEGGSAQSMIDAALAAFMKETSLRLFIPQRTVMGFREILLLQQRLQKIPGRKPENVATRPAFAGALEYLRYRAEEDRSLEKTVSWWERFNTSHPQEVAEPERELKKGGGRRGGRRRRKKKPKVQP